MSGGVVGGRTVNDRGDRETPAVHKTTRNRPDYPASLRAECRRMYEGGGWTAYQIWRVIKGRMGADAPTRQTIMRWVDNDLYERHVEGNRQRAHRDVAATAKFRLPGFTPEYREALVRRLDEAGVMATQIPKVLSVVLDEPLSYNQVRHLLEDGRRGVAA